MTASPSQAIPLFKDMVEANNEWITMKVSDEEILNAVK